jgi:hypothetical protein
MIDLSAFYSFIASAQCSYCWQRRAPLQNVAPPEIECLAAITNSFRSQQNLPRLVLSPSLCRAAQLLTEYWAAHRKQTHDDPGNIGLVTVWDRAHAQSSDWIKVGEYICHGYPDGDSAAGFGAPHIGRILSTRISKTSAWL